MTFKRVSHVAFVAWLLLSGTAAGPSTQAQPTIIFKVVDRGNHDAGVPAADVRVFLGAKLVDKGITDAAGEFPSSVPQIGQVVTIEYEKLTYLKAPERKQVAVKQRPQQASGGLIRTSEVSPYYAAVGDRIEYLTAQLPVDQREPFKTEELARVMALSYENRLLVANSLSADLQADLQQIGTFKAGSETAYPTLGLTKPKRGDLLGGITTKDNLGKAGTKGTETGGPTGTPAGTTTK